MSNEPRQLRAVRQVADPDVVARLRELLEQAERGEILTVIYAGVMTERRVFSGTAGSSEHVDSTIFALEVIKHRTIRDWSAE